MRTRRRLVRRVPAPLRNMVMHLLASFDSVRSAMVVRALGGRSNPARHSPDASLRVVRVQGSARPPCTPSRTPWSWTCSPTPKAVRQGSP
ncbi:hypothetical protein ACWECC_37460, partial [Streptomyces microflavus]